LRGHALIQRAAPRPLVGAHGSGRVFPLHAPALLSWRSGSVLFCLFNGGREPKGFRVKTLVSAVSLFSALARPSFTTTLIAVMHVRLGQLWCAGATRLFRLRLVDGALEWDRGKPDFD